MNVVVTGATSFIGAALVKKLRQCGHQVYAVIRPGSEKVKGTLGDLQGLNLIELDLDEVDLLAQIITSRCDWFFHFGWAGAGSENRKNRKLQQHNVVTSMKALKVARALGCQRFLFSGSQAEYGIHYERTTEETICLPISEYGKAKVDFCEKAFVQCREWKEQGMDAPEYIHTRIYSIYGPGDHEGSLIKTCLDTFLTGQEIALGACDQLWNFLYIDDLVEAFQRLICMPSAVVMTGIYNIAGPSQETKLLKAYIEDLRTLCGSKGTCVYGIRPPNAEGVAQLFPDISKIQQKTGWEPTISFAEGIKRMLRNRCLSCKHDLKRVLMTVDQMPASAQDIPDIGQLEGETGITLELCQCQHCGLVQFNCEPVEYYRDVIRSGGFSTTMVALRERQYEYLIKKYQLQGKHFLEVGCGQGEFLKVLNKFPVEGSGIEHQAALVELARAAGLTVWRNFTETAKTVLEPVTGRKFDVFLSFNFLEHQPDPEVMLRCIYHNLTDEGMGLITVPSLEYILAHDGYYELIRDHLAYYTFETLGYLLSRCGFEVLERELVNRDTLSVIVKKSSSKIECNDTPCLLDPVLFEPLVQSRIVINQEMSEWVKALKQQGKRFAIWGASHQGFTLASTTVLGKEAAYIIDSAPFKQGKFAPASHLPIVAPEYYEQNPVDAILIVAPGYTDEIVSLIITKFSDMVQVYTLRSNHMERLR